MMKLFVVEEANKLLPALEVFVKSIKERKRSLAAKVTEMKRFQRERAALGISREDRQIFAEKQQEAESLERDLMTLIQSVQNLGCVVKDLDEGLVDFPAIVERTPAYLCWKLGEPSVMFWHGVEEGFRGRKPLGPSGGS